MTDRIDILIIGAGVVGLATGRAFALAGYEVLVLESEDHHGTGVSSRNSGVIHAGIYYPEGSLKAQLCVAGKQMLYAYAAERGISHQAIGKMIVAPDSQSVAKLQKYMDRGRVNHVDDLRMMSGAEAREMEPNVRAKAAILSPSTGIIDVHELMNAFVGDIENAGSMMVTHSPVVSAVALDDGILVQIGGQEPYEILAKTVINAAGLSAQQVAASIDGLEPGYIPRRYLAKGHYFSLSGKSPFSRLIYPMPQDGGLGAHSLLDLNGRTRFGPDVKWIETEDYSIDDEYKDTFSQLIRQYYPDLDDSKLHPDFAGIRPKIVGPDIGVTDFMIHNEDIHGVKGLINLFGIESPGLTSSMALGEYVLKLVRSIAN